MRKKDVGITVDITCATPFSMQAGDRILVQNKLFTIVKTNGQTFTLRQTRSIRDQAASFTAMGKGAFRWLLRDLHDHPQRKPERT